MRPFLLLFLIASLPSAVRAQDTEGATPPIVITSPDDATTFPFGSVKEHSLIWDKKKSQLIARIVFQDEDREGTQMDVDSHYFRLPGVTFDAAKGIFYATTAQGESIPVAHIRHELFLSVIQTLPNAVVRIEHPRGRVSVVLEALEPNDPALHAKPPKPGEDADQRNSIDMPGVLH